MKAKLDFLFIVFALFAVAGVTRAATITWTNTAGGNWNLPANWSPNQLPGSNDTVNVTVAGTYAITLNTNASVNNLTIGGAGSGVQTLQGSSFTLTTTNTFINSGGVLNLTNSTFAGTLGATSGSIFNANGMTIKGPTTVAGGAVLNLTGGVTFGNGQPADTNYWLWVQSGGIVNSSLGTLLSYVAVTNAGTINQTNYSITLYNNGSSTSGYEAGLVNQAGGIINLSTSAGISGGYSFEYLINQGTINALSGNSTINIANLTMQGTIANLTSAGTLRIETFTGLGSLTGNYTASAGTIIDFVATASPGTSAGAGLTLGGAGQYQFVSGLLTLPTNTIPNLGYSGGTVVLGPGFQGGVITNLTLSGTTLSNTLPVTGTLALNSCTVLGPTTVAGGAVLNLTGGVTFGNGQPADTNYWLWVQSGGIVNSSLGTLLSYVAVTNAGTINQTNYSITLYNNGSSTSGYEAGLVNQAGGIINLSTSAGISGGYSFEYLINQGTINALSGNSTINIANLTMQGTIANLTSAGTLRIETFTGLGSLTGNYTASAGTIIDFVATASPGTSAGAGLTLGGAGQYQFVSGLLTLPTNTIPNLGYSGGTVVLGPGFQGGVITNLTLSGTTLSNTLPVTGTLALNSCTVLGPTTVAGGAVLNLTGGVTFGNGQPADTNYWLWVQSGGIVNSSLGTLLSYVAVTNAGTINQTNYSITLYNNGSSTSGYEAGLVNQAGGIINLSTSAGISGGYSFEYLINQGTINALSGNSTINIANLTMQGTIANLTSAGTLRIETFTGLGSLTGNYTASAGTIIDFVATASPGTSAGAGLTLGGAGQYQFVSGLLTLPTNTIPNLGYSGGTVVLGPGFQGGVITNLTLSGTTLSNTLPVTGTLALNSCTVLGPTTVAGGAVLNLTGGVTFGNGQPADTNYWLWVQSGGIVNSSLGTLLSYVAVTNAGTINQTNYSITLYNNGSSTSGYEAGLVNQAGGIINLSTSAGISGGYSFEYLINQGTINGLSVSGTSTINVVNFTNFMTLNAQHGTLQLEGTHLALLSSETFSVGLNSATDFGSITYNNTAALNLAQAGTFVVTLNGGYVPAVGAAFKVLTASSTGTFSGMFANFSSPSGAIWKTNYTTTSLILTNVGQITWATPATITYGTALGGSQLNASTTPSVAGAFAYNPVSGTVLDSGAEQLLTATFTPSVIGDAPASFQVPITVLKAPLGVTANNQTKTYGQNFTFAGTEFVPIGLVNGDTTTSASLASAGAISNAPVSGSPYAITIGNVQGDAGLTNYIIAYTNGLLTVNPAPLGITANNRIKTYGQNVTFAGTEFVSSPLQNAETIGTVTLTSAGAISNAPVSGSPYSIVPSAATGGTFTPGNYAIVYTNGTLTVNRAGLTVTANPAARIYGAANPAFSVSYSGFVNNETVSVVSGVPGFSTPATVTSGVGGYAITPLLGTLTAANYSFGPFNNGTLTINPAALGITASNLSKTYGQNLTFAGTEFAANGLLNSDTVTHVTLTSAGAISNAPVSGSPYSIVPSAATGSGLTNYTIAYTNGVLTVNKALLGITANSRGKTYGQNITFAGTEFVSSPLQNAETIGTVTLTSAGAISNAPVSGSPYSIVPSAATGGTFAPGNYTITYTNGALTISPASLGITANNRGKTYGQTVTFAGTEFTPVGLQNSETVGSVTLTSPGAVATASVAGSPYNITPSAATGGTFTPGNYTIGYTNGALSVNKATLTITANSTNKIVGETLTFAGTEFTASGLQNSETIGTVTLTSAGAVSTAAAGPYNIVPSAPIGGTFSQGNYSDIFVDGTLTVSGAPELTLTALGNQYVLTFQSVSGQIYQLQSKTNLSLAAWSSLGGTINGTGGTVNVTNALAGPQSFFQLEIMP